MRAGARAAKRLPHYTPPAGLHFTHAPRRRPDAFDALHLEFIVYLLWGDTALHGRHEQTTLMQFPKALVQTRERIECMLPRIQAGDTYQVRAVAT